MTKKLTAKQASEKADALGILMAQMGPLTLQEKSLKAELAAHVDNKGVVLGEFYQASVSNYDRDYVKAAPLIEELAKHISRQKLAAILKTCTSTINIVVVKPGAIAKDVKEAA